MTRTIDLPRNWTLTATSTPEGFPDTLAQATVPATVPGCVHTDLMAEGLIVDPYVGGNELELLWIGRTDWRYACRFVLDASAMAEQRLELVCDGLDTLATLRLNGVEIGKADNMHRRWRFDLKGSAVEGENELTIDFAAALPFAEARRDRLVASDGVYPAVGNGSNPQHPHNMIRKMACNFGWDWGPVVVTAGVWRPIRVEAWSGARLGDVRPLVESIDRNGTATLEVRSDVVRSNPGEVTLRAALERGGSKHTWAGVLTGNPISDAIRFVVPDAELWWPVGHGEQPLYDLSVWLEDEHGDELDRWSHRVGIKTSELVTTDDTSAPDGPVAGLLPGATMHLRVNGKRLYCKGANWIPDDCFPHRVTPERYRKRITQGLEANMNMLRVWGGGLYEDDVFYDLCAELGVMVWQDFTCACATYPEHDGFPEQFAAEAADNVSRLAKHCALVLLNGCNENFMGYDEFRGGPDNKPWKELMGGRPWGTRYYLETFPQAVAELAPTIPYWPGSPYSGTPDLEQRRANLNEYGNRHIWDVWHGPGQYRNYLAHFPRFSSEFGYHGPPTWPVIADNIPDEGWHWNSDLMVLHNKNGRPGQEHTHERMGDDFVQPTDSFDDWLYLAQVMQARALAMGVEWFRALSPYNSGALYWQLNDCYPVSSWSAIDSYGGLKPLWYATRRFFAPRLITIKPTRVTPGDDAIGDLAVFLHNDDDEPWTGTLTIRAVTLNGETAWETHREVTVPPRASHRFDLPDASRAAGTDAFLVADVPGTSASSGRAYWWPEKDKAMAYPEADLNAELTKTADGYRLTLTAATVVRDLCVFADRLDPAARMSDQQVTLLPGESFAFDIQTDQDMSLEALTQPPVLQSVNRFGGVPQAALA